MTTAEAFAIASSAFSIFLALFAIWLAFQQRRESHAAYEHTRDVLGEVNKVIEKTELLVSDNFQNLLRSITAQQAQMLDSLKPRPTQEERMTELITRLADEPDKLEAMVKAIVQINESQAALQQAQQSAAGHPLAQLLQMAAQQPGNK